MCVWRGGGRGGRRGGGSPTVLREEGRSFPLNAYTLPHPGSAAPTAPTAPLVTLLTGRLRSATPAATAAARMSSSFFWVCACSVVGGVGGGMSVCAWGVTGDRGEGKALRGGGQQGMRRRQRVHPAAVTSAAAITPLPPHTPQHTTHHRTTHHPHRRRTPLLHTCRPTQSILDTWSSMCGISSLAAPLTRAGGGGGGGKGVYKCMWGVEVVESPRGTAAAPTPSAPRQPHSPAPPPNTLHSPQTGPTAQRRRPRRARRCGAPRAPRGGRAARAPSAAPRSSR